MDTESDEIARTDQFPMRQPPLVYSDRLTVFSAERPQFEPSNGRLESLPHMPAFKPFPNPVQFCLFETLDGRQLQRLLYKLFQF